MERGENRVDVERQDVDIKEEKHRKDTAGTEKEERKQGEDTAVQRGSK